MIGESLLHYEVSAFIGEGGMGRVFRARDSRLGRDVALKVLPARLVAEPEFAARFEREAQLLAALQHPHIAMIHGLEQDGERRFLVLELVEGEDLEQRLRAGPVPLDEALEIVRQVAEALEAAHAQGIIHRDLKPANIKVAPDGTVKVLDFGLAKAMEGVSPGGSAMRGDAADRRPHLATTVGPSATVPGMILGTAAYMSPEQARGLEADRRSDIWALGCLLFEMLSGRRAFAGETISDTVASVLRSDPDWEALPTTTPRAIQRLLRRCLEKDSRRRLHDIADARIEIEDALKGGAEMVASGSVAGATYSGAAYSGASGGSGAVSGAGGRTEARAGTRAARRGGRLGWWVLVGAVTLVAGVLGASIGRMTASPPPPPPPPVHRLTVTARDYAPRTIIAIARTGDIMAYPARSETAVWSLKVRHLDSFGGIALAGTEYGANPFFSPDGNWLAFFRDGALRRIPVTGGAVQTICEVDGDATGFWCEDGTMLVAGSFDAADHRSALARVAEAGGEPELLLVAEGTEGDEVFFDPWLMPGGEVLFTVVERRNERIDVLEPGNGERSTLLQDATVPVFAEPDLLVYYEPRSDRLFRVGFDADAMATVGTPGVVLEQVIEYAVSPTGTLIYAPTGISTDDVVVTVSRDGTIGPLLEEPSSWAQPRVAPDGRSLLLRRTASPNCYLWRFDLERQTLTRLTFEGDSHDPDWSPDGREIIFCALGSGNRTVFRMPADGSGDAALLVGEGGDHVNASWSPDGRHILYTETDVTRRADLWYVAADADTDAAPEPFLRSSFDEDWAAFSPDGRWVAYTSNETGREEIYVRPFPGPGAKLQVSRDGGNGALWAPGGREIFYVSGNRMMVVEVTGEAELSASSPRMLFEGDYAFERVGNYDIMPDGRSFVVVKSASEDGRDRGFSVVVNWFAELRD